MGGVERSGNKMVRRDRNHVIVAAGDCAEAYHIRLNVHVVQMVRGKHIP